VFGCIRRSGGREHYPTGKDCRFPDEESRATVLRRLHFQRAIDTNRRCTARDRENENMAGFHARGRYLFPLWPSQGGDKSPSLAMPHKFKVGQAVEYHPPRWVWAPGTYLITAELPERNGE
jgi:hypothetical protein